SVTVPIRPFNESVSVLTIVRRRFTLRRLMKQLAILGICLVTLAVIPASAVVVYLAGGGVTQPTANLPPSQGGYVSPQDVHACFTLGGGANVCLSQGNHFGFDLFSSNQVNGGADQLETFNSHYSGELLFNGGDAGPVSLQGQVQVLLHGRSGGNGTTG